MPGAAYGQARVQLQTGDVLVLHTGGLTAHGAADASGEDGLLALASRFGEAGTAQDCMRLVVEQYGHTERQEDACVLIARVGSR